MFTFLMPVQTSAEKELKESDRLFTSLIRCVHERQTEVDTEISEKQKAAERRAEELVGDLKQEVSELQRRNTELEELRDSEDHLHVLQVNTGSSGSSLGFINTFVTMTTFTFLHRVSLI